MKYFNKITNRSYLTKNVDIFRKGKFLLGSSPPYQCKDGFCIYGLSNKIYGTPENVANACLVDEECKAYDYDYHGGYGHLCKASNSEDCYDSNSESLYDGSGDDCAYDGSEICIKTPGKFHFQIICTYF